MRLDEARMLEWSDVDLDRGLVWIGNRKHGSTFRTKTGNSHTLPLPEYLIEMLKMRFYSTVATQFRRAVNFDFDIQHGVSTYVFASPFGTPLINVYKTFNKAAQRANLHYLQVHDLRRTFTNTLTHPAVAADEFEIKQLLNHVNSDVTRRHYLSCHAERLRPVMERACRLLLVSSELPVDFDSVEVEDVIDVECFE